MVAAAGAVHRYPAPMHATLLSSLCSARSPDASGVLTVSLCPADGGAASFDSVLAVGTACPISAAAL